MDKWSDMHHLVIGVISKAPSERTNPEVDVLLPWLKQRSEQLNNLKTDVLKTLIKKCRYQHSKRDDVIIKQGDKGDCFYIMLTGKTTVYIDTAKSDDDPLPLTNTDDPNHAVLRQWEQEKKTKELDKNAAKPKKMDRTLFGKFIIAFDAGKSFGEIALISEDAVRNASIIADEDTDLLVIDRELFNGTLKAKQEAEYEERKAFIRRSPIFRVWNPKFKRLLEMSLRKMELPFDRVLVTQGQPVIGLHFIIRGQAKVTVDDTAHRAQFPKLFDGSNSVLAKELGRTFQRNDKKTKDGSQQEQIRVRRREGYAAAERRLATKFATLCHVDENEIVGDIEVVLGLDIYTQTVVCTANTEVFILDNKNIERLIYKKNPSTLDVLRMNAEGKLRSRLCMRGGSHIALYTHLLEKLEDVIPKRTPGAAATAGGKDAAAAAPNGPAATSKEDDKPKGINEAIKDRDLMMNQLSKLFLQDKAPFIEPRVPGSVFYMTKSSDRATYVLQHKSQRKTGGRYTSAEVRLQRARKAARRQPRSRRELERLSAGTDGQDMKQLQDKNHAINRFLSGGCGPAGRGRPLTAPAGVVMRAAHGQQGVEEYADSVGVERVFLTEPQYPDYPEDQEGQLHLEPSDINNDAMKQIVLEMGDLQHAQNASRAKIICSMIDQRTHQQPGAVQQLLRPKSAPTRNIQFYHDEEEEEKEAFDVETSDITLVKLEDKIKDFHAQHDREGRKTGAQVPELRRFSIQTLDDVPVPGGTVYVRQKNCHYPSLASSSHHQHVRRFIIPRDAYSIACRSVTAFHENGHEPELEHGGNPNTRVRQNSAGPRRRTSSQTTNHRAHSAPLSRQGSKPKPSLSVGQ